MTPARRLVARTLSTEVRLWACLMRWLFGRHEGRSAQAHPYGRSLRPLLIVLLALVIVEGGLVEGVLALLAPRTPWPWLVLVLHVYALVWIAGLMASLRTRPHLLNSGELRLRDSVFTEIVVPLAAITGARATRRQTAARSGFLLDSAGAAATLAYGEATVTVMLDPDYPIDVDGTSVAGLKCLHITVDDTGRFLQAIATPPPQPAPGAGLV